MGFMKSLITIGPTSNFIFVNCSILIRRLQYAALNLITLDRFKQGFEIAFAEAVFVIADALNELEKDGANARLSEYL